MSHKTRLVAAAGKVKPDPQEEELIDFEMNHICWLMESHYPKEHPLFRKIEFRLHTDGERELATLEELREIRAEFYGLPEAEQRRILNGWRPDPTPRQKQLLLEYLAGETVGVARVLHVNCSHVDVFSCFEEHLRECLTRVEVNILEGTTKAEVLASLERAMNFVREHWEGAISTDAIYDPPVKLAAEKGAVAA